ncbi:DUF4245 domain-containing protein [Mycobacterium sp. Y57]|uniref:DUF4245 domain-containing protein n=1 Tax=Mycolicibacterium xanthum TaxID=2796469 RepID=UPI001C84DDC2|nr:DUF4245 domain-containing protein [Mycolicibacterium xanthum]MBX7433508.1 DUF4245 domain-containing protein [Mycolicibacterium xanthum]
MTTPPEPGQQVAGQPGVDPETAGHEAATGTDAELESYAVPGPRAQKSRLLQDGRDMFWSMAPLVAACVVLAGVLGMCSFAPTGPGPGPAPDHDARSALQADADTLGIPIRVPQLPEGWRSNSNSRRGIEDGRTDPATGQRVRAVVSTIGYLAPSGMYLSLTQSDADEQQLVASFGSDLVPTGTQDVDGVTWVVYEGGERDGRPAEPVWTAQIRGPTGPVQLALTGAGGTDEYRTLAAATQSQSPLTPR